MKEEKLLRLLKTVGMGCFVKYYDMFFDSNMERSNIIEVLVRDEGYKEPASGSRVSAARMIIRAEKSIEAFQLIVEAPRASDFAKDRANELLRNRS